MFDKVQARDGIRTDLPSLFSSARMPKGNGKENDAEDDEGRCAAFGYLRGVHDRALALELRFSDRNRQWFSYHLLASWRYNPSVGLLLKFTGDLTSLVLVRGSNLDAIVGQDALSLTKGLHTHRVTWIGEMDEDELRKAEKGEPTIDRIEVAEFESNEDAAEWVRKAAPAFSR